MIEQRGNPGAEARAFALDRHCAKLEARIAELEAAIAAEREACARIAEDAVEFVPMLTAHHENNIRVGIADRIAQAIRARSNLHAQR